MLELLIAVLVAFYIPSCLVIAVGVFWWKIPRTQFTSPCLLIIEGAVACALFPLMMWASLNSTYGKVHDILVFVIGANWLVVILSGQLAGLFAVIILVTSIRNMSNMSMREKYIQMRWTPTFGRLFMWLGRRHNFFFLGNYLIIGGVLTLWLLFFLMVYGS